MRFSIQTLLSIVFMAAIVAVIGYAFLPAPIPVDLATLDHGLLRVTVDDDGKTRIKERYVVSTPLGGRLLRIGLEPGDRVARGETLLACVEPKAAEMLDARGLAEAEAKVKAADAALNRATPALEHARAELDFAESNLGRMQQLSATKSVSQQDLDQAEMVHRVKTQAYHVARFAEQIARFELEMEKAALVRTRDAPNSTHQAHFEIRAPISGCVLRILQESATAIPAGTPLLEIGDPEDLEVEIDVLSSDAVKIAPGDSVLIEQWGGEGPLEGVVRLIEPQGFTKVSALGIEEQRVNVILDFVDPPERRGSLGDGYRVEARIVIWQGNDVLKVPTSALFRSRKNWSVFVVQSGQAKLRRVEIGRRNDVEAEVISGLQPGEQVIVHPSDKVTNGARVTSQ